MENKFRLPARLFLSKWDYVKYRLGLLVLTDDMVLGGIAYLLKKELGLSNVEKITKFDNDLPGVIAYKGEGSGLAVFGSDLKDYNTSLSKMLGEYIERKVFKTKLFSGFRTKLSMNEIKGLYGAKFASDFHSYDTSSPLADNRTNIDQNFKLESTQVEDLTNSRKIFYPTQCIFYNQLDNDEPFRIMPRNSSGCAGYFNLEVATQTGLLELFERESFLLYWLTKTPARRILLNKGLYVDIETRLKQLEKYGFSVSFYDISSDLQIPTVLLVLEDNRDEEKKVLVSASSGMSFIDAVRKSLVEIGVVMVSYCDKSLWDKVYTMVKENKIGALPLRSAHRCAVLYKENVKEIDFIKNGESIYLLDLESQNAFKNYTLPDLISLLKNKGYHLYRFISNERILNEIGFKVVRVIIPELLPFYMEEALAMKNSNRIKEFIDFKGCKINDLNAFPHPFP